jgi:hypothetical protein
MRQILKIRKMDKDEHDEQESLLDIYKRALGMLPDANATAQAAEWQHPSSKPVVYGRAQRQFGIAIPTPELMDLATVAKLGRRIADGIGITPAATPALTEAEPHADADDELERSAEPALELTLGRFLEQELDRAKERLL